LEKDTLFNHSLKTTEIMGKGDAKSKKGKLTKGSYGKRRPHKPAKKTEKAPAVSAAKA
jgi:30S ribosomal protein S31